MVSTVVKLFQTKVARAPRKDMITDTMSSTHTVRLSKECCEVQLARSQRSVTECECVCVFWVSVLMCMFAQCSLGQHTLRGNESSSNLGHDGGSMDLSISTKGNASYHKNVPPSYGHDHLFHSSKGPPRTLDFFSSICLRQRVSSSISSQMQHRSSRPYICASLRDQ